MNLNHNDMEPKKQNLKRQPVFADVVVEPREPVQSDSSRDVRSQYMKLLYPNGVTLILPVGVSADLLMKYVNSFHL